MDLFLTILLCILGPFVFLQAFVRSLAKARFQDVALLAMRQGGLELQAIKKRITGPEECHQFCLEWGDRITAPLMLVAVATLRPARVAWILILLILLLG